MNIALLFQHKLLQGFQRLVQGPRRITPPAALRNLPSNPPLAAPASRLPALRAAARSTKSGSGVQARPMPLRVLRVVETGQPRACTGRLVISGRMADVCAELDRLVEREAALH